MRDSEPTEIERRVPPKGRGRSVRVVALVAGAVMLGAYITTLSHSRDVASWSGPRANQPAVVGEERVSFGGTPFTLGEAQVNRDTQMMFVGQMEDGRTLYMMRGGGGGPATNGEPLYMIQQGDSFRVLRPAAR